VADWIAPPHRRLYAVLPVGDYTARWSSKMKRLVPLAQYICIYVPSKRA
jgi:hypothetical protein